MILYANTTFHLLTTNLEKHYLAGGPYPISHSLIPTMTFLLSFCGSSIQVENSHPSPFQFLLHWVDAPVMEHY